MSEESNVTKTGLSTTEVEDLIVQLHKAGRSQADIGTTLRDQHGIKSVKVFCGKRVSDVLVEKKVTLEIPEDLLNLIRASVELENHLKVHPKDMTAKRGLELAVSKIRRLGRYYVNCAKLPGDWRYTSESARLLVK